MAESNEFAEIPENKAELEAALQITHTKAYAAGTVRNLLCQWRSFLRFSKRYKIHQWPVSEHTLCLFAQFLAYSFHSAKSVRNYLYGVRTMHILARVDPPNLKDIEIRLTLRGLSKILSHRVKQAQPLTPEILLDMLSYLNLNKRADLVFWGILLTGFFGMLRKSNLITDAMDSFDPVKQMTRGHISFSGDIIIIKATWTKTIQCRERVVEIPIFPIPDSPLCPVTAIRAIMAKKGRRHQPLFGSGNRVLFTYNQFQSKFKKVLTKAGYRASAFSSHSMRRGGTIFAHHSGVPESLIQVHGDWLSNCFKRYLQFPIEIRAVVSLKMRESIIRNGW